MFAHGISSPSTDTGHPGKSPTVDGRVAGEDKLALRAMDLDMDGWIDPDAWIAYAWLVDQ